MDAGIGDEDEVVVGMGLEEDEVCQYVYISRMLRRCSGTFFNDGVVGHVFLILTVEAIWARSLA